MYNLWDIPLPTNDFLKASVILKAKSIGKSSVSTIILKVELKNFHSSLSLMGFGHWEVSHNLCIKVDSSALDCSLFICLYISTECTARTLLWWPMKWVVSLLRSWMRQRSPNEPQISTLLREKLFTTSSSKVMSYSSV